MPQRIYNQPRVLDRPTSRSAAAVADISQLADFTAALTETTELNRLGQVAVTKLQAIFSAEEVSLWFYNAARSRIEAAAGTLHPLAKPISINKHSELHNLLRGEQPRDLKGVDRERLAVGKSRGQLTGVPLIVGNHRIGLLSLITDQPISAAAKEVLLMLGRQVAMAVTNAANASESANTDHWLELHTRKIQQLYQTLERFTRARTEAEVMKLIPKLACSALQYNYAAIAGIDGATVRFSELAVRKPYATPFMERKPELKLADLPMLREVMHGQQPVAVNDPRRDPQTIKAFAKDNFANYALVPVCSEGQVLAVLFVAHHRGAGDLLPADLELLGAFSRICAFALSNIRYQTYRQRATDIANLRAENAEEFAAGVITHIPEMIGAKDAVISLPDQSGVLRPAATTNPDLNGAPYQRWLSKLPFSKNAFPLPPLHTEAERSLPYLDGSLHVPITYKGGSEVLGLIHVFERTAGSFSTEDISALQLASIRIGHFLKNIELVRRLKDERQQFASIVEGSADGIVSLDADETVRLINPAMLAMTGFTATETQGQPFGKLFQPLDENGNDLNLIELSRSEERSEVRNATLLTHFGTRKWFGITAAPQAGDRSDKSIVVVRDISEQRELSLRQQEFVSIASHELRTPITALIGYLSLLQSATTEDDRPRFIDRAYKSAMRLSDLVEDLLAVARIEEGRLSVTMREVNPSEIVDEVVTHLQPMMQRKNVSLTYDNRLRGSDLIKADPSKVQQIFSNLVDNAVKYTPIGGRVTIRSRSTKQAVTLTIEDNGIGIHQDNLERIFEKFFREYSELSTVEGGTGLGLFITKELVNRQDGQLKIKSTQGVGTVAEVSFPRAEPSRP